MTYKVIHDFKDLQDDDHIYRAGNKYPRKGKVKKERIEELQGADNNIGKPLITKVGAV